MSEVVENEVVEEVDVMQEALDDFNSDLNIPVEDDFDTPIEIDEKETTSEVETEETAIEDSEEKTDGEEVKEELHHLKHFNGDKDVTYDELIALAQEGIDRKRIVGQRDEARNDPRLAVADRINKLSELYEYSNVDKLVDALYNSYDEQQGQEAGTTTNKINDDTKKAQELEQAEADKPYNDFVSKYPDVKADEIPQEVWSKVNSGESILKAYDDFVGNTKEQERNKEVDALKAEIAILKKNTDNKTKTKTGSIEGKSDGVKQESYLDIWD